MRTRVYFPDGTMMDCDSPAEFFARLAEKQFVDHQVTVDEMKELLSDRAWGWNTTIIDPRLDDEAFLKKLGKSGVVFVHFGDDDPFA